MIDDDNSLREKYSRKKSNAKRKGIGFSLSFDEYVDLVRSAGLVASDIGRVGGYDLARYGDEGPYAVGNCRFITHGENVRERKRSRRMLAHFQNSVKAIHARRNALTPEERSEIVRSFPGMKRIMAEAQLRESARMARLNASYRGSANSQFGTFWITDGTVNRKWGPDKGNIPVGFFKGRVTKK